MSNEKDWKELEEWEKKRKQEEKEKFKIDFSEIDKDKEHKGVDRLVKGLKITGNISKIFTFIVFLIATIAIIMFLYIKFANIKARTDVEVIKTIENMYNTKVNVISANIDEKNNGTYILKIKDNNEIQFTAIKKFGNLSEDYSDNCHKYYFEKWESKEKEKFTISETINSNILDYDTYIRINSYEELENAMDIINNFVNYCGNNFNANWRIYLKKGDYTIYPYNQNGISNEEATNNAKELWNKYFK